MDCIGQLIITAPTCDDTFVWARELLPMASDGTVLIAHKLTQARGRQGRTWVVAEGQISHTIILKPDIYKFVIPASEPGPSPINTTEKLDPRLPGFAKPFDPSTTLRSKLLDLTVSRRAFRFERSRELRTKGVPAHPEEEQSDISRDAGHVKQLAEDRHSLGDDGRGEDVMPTLTMALALGLWQPLQKFGATLKWPNDLSLNNKKLSGMLIQNLWHDNQLTGIIFGYSINVNNSCINNEQLKDIATSLSDATGTKHDLGLLQTELFASLSRFYEQWKRGEFHEIFKLWRKNQGYLGKQIQVHNRDFSLLEGIAQDVLPCGALVLKTEQTEPIIVSFAQVEEVKI